MLRRRRGCRPNRVSGQNSLYGNNMHGWMCASYLQMYRSATWGDLGCVKKWWRGCPSAVPNPGIPCSMGGQRGIPPAREAVCEAGMHGGRAESDFDVEWDRASRALEPETDGLRRRRLGGNESNLRWEEWSAGMRREELLTLLKWKQRRSNGDGSEAEGVV